MNVTQLATTPTRKPNYGINSEKYRRIGIAEHSKYEKEVEEHMTRNESSVQAFCYSLLRAGIILTMLSGVTAVIIMK